MTVKATFAGHAIRTDFVLNLMRNTKWENRRKILDMIQLERYVLEGPSNWIDAMGRGVLQQKYPDEWRAIEAELLPPGVLAEKERRSAASARVATEAQARHEAEEKAQEESAKRDWLALGGKP